MKSNRLGTSTHTFYQKWESILIIFILLISLFPQYAVADRSSATEAEFLQYANEAIGKSYKNNLCLQFVSDFFSYGGNGRLDVYMGFPGAYNLTSAYYCYYHHVTRHDDDWNIPIGADVFFDGWTYDSDDNAWYEYGHVGIYIGDGYFIEASGGTVNKKKVDGFKTGVKGGGYKEQYLGWAWHPHVEIISWNIPRKNVLSGVYIIHSARNDNYVLDIFQNSTGNDAKIQLYEKQDNSSVQRFRIIRWDNDYYCIQSMHSGKWLDVALPIEDKAKVKLYYENEADEDYWYFEDAGDGYVYIKNKTGYYLDLENDVAKNNANIQIYSFVDEDNKSQKWRLEDVTNYYDLEDGLYTVSTARNNDYQLDIYGNQTGNRAEIQLYKKEDSTVQLFRFIKKGSYYLIKSVYADKYLDIRTPIQNKSRAQLWESSNAPEQHWILEDAGNGYVYIRSDADYYLDVEDNVAENNATVSVFRFANNNSQRWRLNSGEHTVTYNANGGTGEPFAQTKVYGTSLTLSTVIPNNQDEYFAEWNTKEDGTGDGFKPGAVFRLNEDTILYAIWATPDFILPDDLNNIEDSAFYGCAFEFAKIPDGSSSIGEYAFARCDKLKYIFIPESVTSIGDKAFEGVTGLTIHGIKGSYAETYAGIKGYNFIAG